MKDIVVVANFSQVPGENGNDRFAYLANSRYGVGSNEVRINNNNQKITGCGASNEDGGATSTCQIKYGNASLYPQSTTGNISGIFDMSGGLYEYLMGNYNKTIDQNKDGWTTMPDEKYYDLYKTGSIMTTNSLEQFGGHALYETAGWNGDNTSNLVSGYPWVIRGGLYSGGSKAGIFSLSQGSGVGASNRGFRSVIINGFSNN